MPFGEWRMPIDEDFIELQRQTSQAIAEARKRLNPHYGGHPSDPIQKQDSIEAARRFLDSLARDAAKSREATQREKDSPFGDARGSRGTEKENRRMLDVLGMVARGMPLKEIALAMPEYGPTKLEAGIRYLSARLPKFCKRVCVQTRHRFPLLGDESISCMSGNNIVAAVAHWPGVDAFSSADAPALCKAIELYFSKHPKLTREELGADYRAAALSRANAKKTNRTK
jgi:hypothetical protein